MEGCFVEESKVVQLFGWIEELTNQVQTQLNEPNLDSLAIVLEAIFYGEFHEEYAERIDEATRKSLHDQQLDTEAVTDITKAIQLLVLKGMRETTQQNHTMTPEAISLFIGYLADKLMKNQTDVRVFDPASGTGNLLLIVMGHLKQNLTASASEVDPTLIKLALYSANLQKKHVNFFHQDSLKPLLLDPVDLVVSDLPVGYYPDDVQAAEYELKATEGHSYAHHLFIEQSLKHTKDNGYLIFLIPEFLFESDQAEQLREFIQAHAQIIGLLQLPETAFSSKENRKSILIMQKKGPETVEIKQPLLAMLPSFNETELMEDILVKINRWFEAAELV